MQTVHYLYAKHKEQGKTYLLVKSLNSTYDLSGQRQTLGTKHEMPEDVIILDENNQVLRSGDATGKGAPQLPLSEVEWIQDMIVLEA